MPIKGNYEDELKRLMEAGQSPFVVDAITGEAVRIGTEL